VRIVSGGIVGMAPKPLISSNVASWLPSLGLGKYEAAFCEGD
jgi:hypothetical protein